MPRLLQDSSFFRKLTPASSAGARLSGADETEIAEIRIPILKLRPCQVLRDTMMFNNLETRLSLKDVPPSRLETRLHFQQTDGGTFN